MEDDFAPGLDDPALDRCVAAMARGDRAFIITFAERFGPALRSAATDRGYDPAPAGGATDRLVADIAVEVFDRAATWNGSARDLVEDVVDDVVSGPEGVVGQAPCGGDTNGAGSTGDTRGAPRRAERGSPRCGDVDVDEVAGPDLPDELGLPRYGRDWTRRPALRPTSVRAPRAA